jgi:hypothetical protein
MTGSLLTAAQRAVDRLLPRTTAAAACNPDCWYEVRSGRPYYCCYSPTCEGRCQLCTWC